MTGRATELEFLGPVDRQTAHFFRYLNQVLLNKSNPDLLVNVLEYHQIDKNQKNTKFSWVIDIEITDENVYKLMRAGRARWKAENETFNTLENQGDKGLKHLDDKHDAFWLAHMDKLGILPQRPFTPKRYEGCVIS